MGFPCEPGKSTETSRNDGLLRLPLGVGPLTGVWGAGRYDLASCQAFTGLWGEKLYERSE